MISALLLLVAAAAAQDPPPAPEAPPAGPPAAEAPAASPPVAGPPPPGRPLAIPAAAPAPLTPEKLSALRAYKARRLAVRDELVVRGGGYNVVGTGWGGAWGPYGPWGWGYGSAMVLPEPTQVNRVWALYQGRERLDTLRFLDLTNQADLRARVAGDIQRFKRRSTVWFSLAGLGAAGLVGGMVTLDLATTREEAILGNRIILAGTGLATVGLLSGSFPRAKADRLRTDPRTVVSHTEAQELADAHNERLRTDLGLSPADVWALESDAGDR